MDQTLCFLPKDTPLLGSSRGSAQHLDDYIAVTSQSHHEFLHIPPPKHGKHHNSLQKVQIQTKRKKKRKKRQKETHPFT